MESPRLQALRRRVDKDPASIAFAQLAEECRRAGKHEEAIRVARAGLARHPDYVSARVTLGLALLASSCFADARIELERASRQAPDNLAASRALLELNRSRPDQPATVSPDVTTGQLRPIAPRDIAVHHPDPAPVAPAPAPEAGEPAGLGDLVQEVDTHWSAAEAVREDPLVGLDDWLANTSTGDAGGEEQPAIPDLPVPDSQPEADPLPALDAWLDKIVANRETARRRD